MVLRFLSGIASRRAPVRYGGDLRAQARADFEGAWAAFLSNRTEADFEKWRYQRDVTAWKYAMWDAGKKLPTQLPGGRSLCFCGAAIDIAGVNAHVRAAHGSKVDA
jgi:N-acetylneuraminic acid mutarotase